MCGRFVQRYGWHEVQDLYELPAGPTRNLPAHYNIAPTDPIEVVRLDVASETETAFAELVEDYLATCAELGKQPCKPFKGSFNVRVTPELHRQVAMAAAELKESMNAWISKAMEARIERQKVKKAFFDPSFLERFFDSGPVSTEYSYTGAAHRRTSLDVTERMRSHVVVLSAFRAAREKQRSIQ
jgi:predicted HicB family RNase H-like nuclease